MRHIHIYCWKRICLPYLSLFPRLNSAPFFPSGNIKLLFSLWHFAEIAEIVREAWTEILQALPPMPISTQTLSPALARVVPGVGGFDLSLGKSPEDLPKDTLRKCRFKSLKEGHPTKKRYLKSALKLCHKRRL